jgi:diadenosine tetraphosphate (Ap4A) HIT family hydrolase
LPNLSQRVSAALAAGTDAVKLNYKIHGNSLPHLHMHFFPRYRGDQFEGQPINPKSVTQPVHAAGEFQRICEKFLRALNERPNERGMSGRDIETR